MRRDSDACLSSRPRTSHSSVPRRDLVLYVEDDDDNWEVAELCLGERFTLLRARTDREACQIIRDRHADIDAILMDIELRGSELNGTELTELLRGSPAASARGLPSYARGLPTVSQPMVFVTAHGARYTDVQLMLFGADRVVSKPLDFHVLHTTLGDLLRGRHKAR
jgi:CheY-like chemotaxis protein